MSGLFQIKNVSTLSLKVDSVSDSFSFGLVYALGALTFVLAINLSGSAIKVVALSALYPIVTALLFYFLSGQSLSARKIAGIVLAVIVGWLMA